MRCKLSGLLAKECRITACLQFGLFEELKKNGSLHEKMKPHVPLCNGGQSFVDEGGQPKVRFIPLRAKRTYDEMEV